jgi:dolichol-phosphate mannosyltransferase
MQILVVDDSSPDGTGSIVQDIAKTQKNVHLLTNAKKNGLGAAYLAGMKEAFSALEADVVFEFDADLSHDPTKIPLLLQKIDEGYDLVLGSRYVKGGSIPSNWGLHRKFLSVFGNLFIGAVMTTFKVRDWTAGYRAITKKVYDAVEKEMHHDGYYGYTFQIAFLHKTIRKGFSVAEIPIHFVDRTIGNLKLGTEYLKNTMVYVIRARFLEIVQMRVFKFAVVGFIGFFINTLGLFIFSLFPAVQQFSSNFSQAVGSGFINTSGVSSALGAECAIVSNFLLNNFWTFKDRKLTSPLQAVAKFIQFNLASFGSVLIQFSVVGTGTYFTGVSPISNMFWLMLATGIGMVVNFFVYSTFIWKKK